MFLQLDRIKKRYWRSFASLAGPLGTLLVLMALGLIVALLGGAAQGGEGALVQALALLAYLQASALVLNLLPVPGLDGFGIIRPFLPASVIKVVAPLSGIFLIAVFFLVLMVPEFGSWLFGVAGFLTETMGIPGSAIDAGFEAFHFWQQVS